MYDDKGKVWESWKYLKAYTNLKTMNKSHTNIKKTSTTAATFIRSLC